MRPSAVLRLACVLILLVALPAARGARAPFPAPIGNSVVVLTGPWAFHPGDDMAWAARDFDDSAWGVQNLTPPPGSYDPTTGITGFVPGWTAQGYPRLTGFAWYRLHVNLTNATAGGAEGALALKMPENFDDAYQVFVDGRYIGQFGGFLAGHVTFYNAAPRAFPLPAGIRSGPVTIAIRFWMDTATPLDTQDAGGLHNPLLIGQASAIDAMEQLSWYAIDRAQGINILQLPLLILTALLGFVLFRLDRREQVYLWLALASICSGLRMGLVALGYYGTWYSMSIESFLYEAILPALQLGVWTVFWARWFRLDGMRRLHLITWTLVAVLTTAMAAIRAPFYGSLVPASASVWLVPLSLALKLALGSVILVVAWKGIRARRAEGWVLVPLFLLTIVSLYNNELAVVHIPTIFHAFGLVLGVGHVANLLTMCIIAVLLMRRFIRGQREREHLLLEIEQARQVQQVLIPEALPDIPGFKLESEYRPAQQVGGDFFQIVPLGDGAVLLVIGDVSGKGMPAAMIVSLLVGTVRTLARFTHSPQAILEAMNVRMMGRSQGGFTTCLVARVDRDGTVTLANAGHLAPYLEGQEVEIESGLPLGLSAASTYPETGFRLERGRQLTLLTDGIVEARNAAGELFGFDRTAALAREPAGGIAVAAQAFGQQDDITVLTLNWAASY